MSRRPAVLGGGSVGLALAARLASQGPVRVLTRRPEAAAALARGLIVEDPAAGTERRVAVEAAVLGTDTVSGCEPVHVCVRSPDTEAAAAALRALAPGVLAVSVQNDVDNLEVLARHFPRVVGVVWRQTATRVGEDRVRFVGRGRAVVGAGPGAERTDVRAVAAPLAASGLSVSVSEHIHEDLWLKLCVNLMSAPNALVRRADHTTHAFVEVKARLLEEAARVLAAAGIRARPCDGEDRTLEEEIRFQRGALARGASARSLPLYNHVWTGLSEGRPLEADRYHRRILELAARHDLEAPTHARVLEALMRAAREGRGPESLRATALLAEER